MNATDFRLYATSRDGKKTELTQLARTVQWSGDHKAVSRQLGFSILQKDRDGHQPKVSLSVGAAAELTIDGESVFGGNLLDHGADSAGVDSDWIAYDWGLYLKRNSEYYKVSNQTPEEVTRKLADVCGFSAGNIVATGVRLNRNFLPGSYYEIIKTLYDLASATTGVKYQLRFRGAILDVIEKTLSAESLLLVPGSNLLSCRQKESGVNLVNRVKIYDDAGGLIGTEEDRTAQALYGVFQQAILASSYDDPTAQAKQLLTDGELSTTLVCDCIGSPRLITGNTAVVREPVTSTYGLFYIVSDVHSWQKGLYRTRVQISLKDLVSEAEAAQTAAE